jgi:hypothetical protein
MTTGALKQIVCGNGRTIFAASLFNVANPSGSGTSPVSVTISNLVDSLGNGMLPVDGRYGVVVSTSQACLTSISNKTASGFEITLTPVGGAAIQAGSFDCWVST